MSPALQKAPELLAPAGGPVQLLAAIANGADAVYLGVDVLNARRGATNFNLDDLAETCRFAHIRGVRVYLTVNVVVLPAEMESAVALVDRAWAAGVDAVIVQDLGLLWAIRGQLSHVRVHASTQLNAHNTPTVGLLGELGVSRVTLARELSIPEIAQIVSESDIEVESFVHGALCMCYSGQCLLSSLVGRRSANRGMCAQPCRLPYELVDLEGTIRSTVGSHLLSPKDLSGLAVLPELVASGVKALKIEGRMKSPEYVAVVTGIYRSALDRVLADPSAFEVGEGERTALAETYSRGSSEAYLIGERGNEMMSYQRPNNRGLAVGRVSEVLGQRATVVLDRAIESRDTLEFWTSEGHFAQLAGKLTVSGGEHDSAPAGAKAILSVQNNVASGDRVFRVRNAALMAAAERTYAHADAVASRELDFEVAAVAGEPLSICVRDAAGVSGCATGADVEPARTKAVTAEEIAEHVGRLGGTPYRPGRWAIHLSSGVGIGFSALHRARRDALSAYEEALLAPWAQRHQAGIVQPCPVASATTRPRTMPRLVVSVSDEETAAQCLLAGADEAFVPFGATRMGIHPAGKVATRLPCIAHDRELRSLLREIEPGTKVVAGNLGLLRESITRGAVVDADWSINAVNACTLVQLHELGASRVWLSPELSAPQIAEVVAASPLPTGLSVYGWQELMVTEHCILMSEGDCVGECGRCPRRGERRVLRDRKGYEFPVFTDAAGRSHVHNSVVLDLTPALADIVSAGLSAVRLDLALETSKDALAVTRRFRQIIERLSAGIEPPAHDAHRVTTTGHYFRGVV